MVTRMVVMARVVDLVACSHHFLVVAETKVARAGALAVCSHRSLDLAINTAAPVAVSPASCRPSQAADRVVVVCSARVALMRIAQVALKAITALHRRPQVPQLKVMEDTSNLATAHSHQQASSQAITMRTLQLINKAMKCLMLSHHSRLTMDLTAILSSSSSHRTAMAKEVTGSKGTIVDTSTARVATAVGTRLKGE